MFNNTWWKGISLGRKQCIRLVNDCVIPARSETIITVQCNDRNGHLLGDFEPRKNFGNYLYLNHAQVVPNVNGIFYVSALNPTNSEILLNKRTVLGSPNTPGETVLGSPTRGS